MLPDLAEYARRVVDACPQLSPAQVDALSVLLAPALHDDVERAA
jgi:hypothetical protein